ncbi:hypothetical protein SAMN05421780_10564 [Flexibacter flexilis DSM 6793]|uniref:HNH nuclease domain-containing protein n=1 Tax=Flexibacter flexilis DSM 6793 TaxID=927664 RepID=A0A1I1IR30_9BACT|nr:HNH endonuclease [Flexibacter flexilis]SFC38747.1 hypothetical protein SAMN05421780_10564 [Flexibacter flexilis DSM 6793]
MHTINLKNTDKQVVISDDAHKMIMESDYLKSIDFLAQLRLHSNGYAFYQKNYPNKETGIYRNETIYLHKYIAEQLIERPQSDRTLYVMFKNGNRLDCRTENLEWAPRSQITRNTRKTTSKAGFRGVYRDGVNYRATIYDKGTRYELGFFKTAEEAAEAYKQKSIELFGSVRH